MATWTANTYPFGSLLTSTKMTATQDNFTALAQGATGAPTIQNTAMGTAWGTVFYTPTSFNTTSGRSWVHTASRDMFISVRFTTSSNDCWLYTGVTTATAVAIDRGGAAGGVSLGPIHQKGIVKAGNLFYLQDTAGGGLSVAGSAYICTPIGV